MNENKDDIERSEQQEKLIRDSNRLFHLKTYLQSKAIPEEYGRGSVVNLEDIDLDELEYVTRISKDELQDFLEKMVFSRFAFQEEGTVKFHFFNKITGLWSDLKPNENFDNKHFDWPKPNRIPRKNQA